MCLLYQCVFLEWVDGQIGKGRVLGRAEWEKRGKRIVSKCWEIIMHVDQEVRGDEEGWSPGVGSSAQYFRLQKT